MASSRASSPGSESSPTSALQLTPNSKIRALLAPIDNDSDDEGVIDSARLRLKRVLAKNNTLDPNDSEQQASQVARSLSIHEPKIVSETSDEDEEEIIRPAGRMAARMLANKETSDGERQQTASDARERVKRMLMAKNSPEPIVDENGEDSDAFDAFISSRKRTTGRPPVPKTTSSPRNASPDLFVSPTSRRSASTHSYGSGFEDLPRNPVTEHDRLQALVARKRQERAAEDAKKANQLAERRKTAAMSEEEDDLSDREVEKRLTQAHRPARKASKKAMEEMLRETQRLSRNNQLTHKPVTKKKFTVQDYLSRFKSKETGMTGQGQEIPQPTEYVGPTSSSSASQSDAEKHETPPTSPASHGTEIDKSETAAFILTSSPPMPDKGKGKASGEPTHEPQNAKKKYQRSIRISSRKSAERKSAPQLDSDSDLEIVDAKTPDAKMKRLDAIFDRIPKKQAKESRSLHALKMLAHLTSPGKQSLGKDQKSSITNSEMQISLQQKARQQAAREREERLQALRDKGIIIQTAEEREKEIAEVENLIAKARREADEIMQKEKAAAKKGRKVNGEADPLGDSSDDEDWEEEKDDLAEELSGSDSEAEENASGDDANDASGEEDEEEEEEEETDEIGLNGPESAETEAPKTIFDSEALENEEAEADTEANLYIDEEALDDVEEEEPLHVNQKNRRPRNNVISDDEESLTMETPIAPRTVSPKHFHPDSPIAPNSVLRSATKTFIPGVTVAGPAGLGLTQIFAGTMDDSQVETGSAGADSMNPQFDRQNDPMDFLKQLPAPELPPFVPTMPSMGEDSQDMVMDSQSGNNNVPESQTVDSQTQAMQLEFFESQIHGFDSLVDPMATQMSEFPNATQDIGFQHMTPIKGRFVEAPPSTIDTILIGPTTVPETTAETPNVKRKGKLRRRAQVAAFSDEEDAQDLNNEVTAQGSDFILSANVFDVMRKASKKKELVEDFNKNKSEAKAMINEQAEESEDEYAGLGGASDDDSGSEEDDYVKEMIDDEGGNNVNERELAAFFADRERANDEKQVEKLYNDISKGMLRRKRGADYDLSDSDDGGEARRRMKQKKFAKMQRALLADEKLGKIAENPKRQAFLRAIEDRGSDDEMDFLEDFAEQDNAADSQSQSQAEDSPLRVPDSQPDVTMDSLKRKRPDNAAEGAMRPPPSLRRTKLAKKPSNISEIRESLSSLIEEPNHISVPTHSDSETDDELEIEGAPGLEPRREREKENRDPFALRRTNVQTVDRIALKRASSSSVSANARLAFSTSLSTTPGFKVPALLRRATTNNSIASGSSSTNSSVSGGMSATERMAGGPGTEGIRRGGGKNSGVHFFARESERRAAVMKTEKRREQKRFKGAEVRRKVVGGLFGGGKFE